MRPREEQAFTLVELLVVIAIIAVLAGLLTPVIGKARKKSQRIQCGNRLKNIGTAATMYADDYRNRYPWPRAIRGGGTGQLSSDADARSALELLYKHNYLDDPEVYVCPAANDEIPEEIEDQRERRETFALEDFTCSYTWRNRLTTVQSPSKTPLSGDKRGGEADITNHVDGRNVVFKNGNVEWFPMDKLESDSKEARRFRRELIGFGTTD